MAETIYALEIFLHGADHVQGRINPNEKIAAKLRRDAGRLHALMKGRPCRWKGAVVAGIKGFSYHFYSQQDCQDAYRAVGTLAERMVMRETEIPPVTAEEMNDYAPFFPEYCRASIRRALQRVKLDCDGKLSQITVDYYLKPTDCGGLGMGITQDELDVADMGGDDSEE